MNEELHFALYRKQIPVKQWQAEVLTLGERVHDVEELNAELERRSTSCGTLYPCG